MLSLCTAPDCAQALRVTTWCLNLCPCCFHHGRWLAPKAAPGSTDIRGAGTEGGKDEAAAAMARPDKPKVKTAGVEAALDFVKQRTAAAPSFGGVSVKEQIQKELARRYGDINLVRGQGDVVG